MAYTRIVGSNPTVSAKMQRKSHRKVAFSFPRQFRIVGWTLVSTPSYRRQTAQLLEPGTNAHAATR